MACTSMRPGATRVVTSRYTVLRRTQDSHAIRTNCGRRVPPYGGNRRARAGCAGQVDGRGACRGDGERFTTSPRAATDARRSLVDDVDREALIAVVAIGMSRFDAHGPLLEVY